MLNYSDIKCNPGKTWRVTKLQGKRYGLKTSTSDEVRQECLHFFTISQSLPLQPVWPTKIILRLLAANLSTTANQLSATSVLIQQRQHGDYKKNDVASFAEQQKHCTRRWWSRTESFFSECRFLSFERIFSKKSFNLLNLPSSTSTLFPSWRSACPFLNCDQFKNFLKNFQVNLHFTHYAEGKYVIERKFMYL